MGSTMVTIPLRWCKTHEDVADPHDTSCGYALDYVQPGCVLVPCFIEEEATDGA